MEHGHDHVIRLRKPQEVNTPVRAEATAHTRPLRSRQWRAAVIPGIAFVLGIAAGFALKPMPQNAAPVATYAPPAGTKPAPHTETDVVKAVGNLIELPTETPSIATVTDLAPLQDQAFFARAAVGDVVLMFPQSRKALLYRPSENKLIEAAPLTLSQ